MRRTAPSAAALLAICLACACGNESESSSAAEPAATANPTPSRTAEPSVDPDAPPFSWTFPGELAPAFERVVLVTIDTLRADHLPSYGYPRDTAPFFERLARDGVLFRHALASISHTAPSHASILTGLPPSVHGVRENGEKLAGAAPTLAKLFAAAGFETAAFLSVGFLQGVALGFEHVAAHPKRAPALIDDVLTWLHEGRTRARFFLWVHLYEPHRWKKPMQVPGPELRAVRSSLHWEPRELYDYIAELHGLPDPAPDQPFSIPWLGALSSGEKQAPRSREEVLAFVDDYDALIRHADEQIERLHSGLTELGLPGATLWILTADHGEGLGSHGYAGHGARIYNEQLHVPLLFQASDGSLPAHVVDSLVQHVDLLPTLAELLGASLATPHSGLLGQSLVPLLRASLPEGAGRYAFAEKKRADEESDEGELFALQDKGHKLILHPDGREEFFQLGSDPLELEDIDPQGIERERLRRELEARLRLYSRIGRKSSDDTAPEYLDELKDLGYVR